MINLKLNYRDGAHVEISGDPGNYTAVFENENTGEEIWRCDIGVGEWAKTYQKYYIPWRISILRDGNKIYQTSLNLDGKRVAVFIESSSLGDNLAWIPYLSEFGKKHNCEIHCVSNLGYPFKDSYSDVTFISFDEYSKNESSYFARYRIGWFIKENSEVNTSLCPNDIRTQPMQKSATDVLGLEYHEMRPIINGLDRDRPKKNKVTIGIQSTAQAKYWNNEDGWNKVCEYLIQKGYDVVDIDKDKVFGSPEKWNTIPDLAKDDTGNIPLYDRIKSISESKLFIGLGSGLSWLAWAVGTPVVLISGFSKPYTEPSEGVTRIFNPDVCNGCFNDPSLKIDPSDWMWCPRKKGTPDQFVCTKSITPEMVISELEKLI